MVFATAALGKGINLRDVNTIIHYGGAQSIDGYIVLKESERETPGSEGSTEATRNIGQFQLLLSSVDIQALAECIVDKMWQQA